MTEQFEELDKLPSSELRHRAFKLAEHRLDVKFFWSLLEMIPATESAEGRPEKHATEVESTRTWLADYLAPGHPLEDAMRPIFIDYLEQHGAGAD